MTLAHLREPAGSTTPVGYGSIVPRTALRQLAGPGSASCDPHGDCWALARVDEQEYPLHVIDGDRAWQIGGPFLRIGADVPSRIESHFRGVVTVVRPVQHATIGYGASLWLEVVSTAHGDPHDRWRYVTFNGSTWTRAGWSDASLAVTTVVTSAR